VIPVDQRTCTFCGEPIELGTGKMVVRKDGTVNYFCSSKCEKNVALGRVARRVRWTREFKKRR